MFPEKLEPGMLFAAPCDHRVRVLAFRLMQDIDMDPEDVSGQHLIWIGEGDRIFRDEGFTCFLTAFGLRMINKFDLLYVGVEGG